MSDTPLPARAPDGNIDVSRWPPSPRDCRMFPRRQRDLGQRLWVAATRRLLLLSAAAAAASATTPGLFAAFPPRPVSVLPTVAAVGVARTCSPSRARLTAAPTARSPYLRDGGGKTIRVRRHVGPVIPSRARGPCRPPPPSGTRGQRSPAGSTPIAQTSVGFRCQTNYRDRERGDGAQT